LGFGACGYLEDQFVRLLERGPKRVNPLTIPMAMPNSVAAHLAMRFGFEGETNTLSTACASGTSAIGAGLWMLRSGRADRVVCGGVDSMLTRAVLSFFNQLETMSTTQADGAWCGPRPFSAERDGFVMGEGAAVLVLERLDTARALGDEVLGIVHGYGATSDAYH